ncbi:DUF5989 family protein [Candidatus Pseudothioglobus singularis]|nr:DUF5989 family protein [Candidatus Pseudothioglobus singularis]
MSFFLNLWRFLIVRKKFWLLPGFIMITIFILLILFSQGSAENPFSYNMF